MAIYDRGLDRVLADERYVCYCVKCGQERLKKRSVRIMASGPHSCIVRTVCYLCPSCYANALDELGVAEK